ncbi:CAP domain-containing protein [Streptomyces sp. NBC_01433]|uniref:CAP domain-containing protein n=1 Tax=Streptomyces sp. NBC_01433 TaxID=2903864 RepID=UPI00225083EC|nr:CAP domain-containing protein [Streptomyces sp. NBC_01433]MCX4673981.1 CAP domain-containing protein [Streptomyces sp. NBC_01433]
MGRHGRSAADPAAEDNAAGAAFGHRGTRRKKRASLPVRAGLLGVSAAVAAGAVALATGLLPGGDTHTVGGTSTADQLRSGGAPDLLTQGGDSAEPTDRASASASTPAGRGSARPKAASKSASASATPSKPAAAPSKKPTASSKAPSNTPAAAPRKTTSPATKAPAAPKTSSAAPSRKAPAPSPSTTSAQATILALVNQERSKVGCSPVTTSAPLTALAQNFSEDMAARGFFDHTDPDGATPWDRAAKAGIQGLGGENIARGQADAKAAMEAWMNSDGHRANILNCDYKTLGVGMHAGSGGPWWTQDFGF